MSLTTATPQTEKEHALTLPPELQNAISRVTEINSLPEVTARIVEVVEDPKSTASDMHDIVKNDPALAAKILKVVNSAFYGLPAQVSSLDRAIVMLGMSAVKNIALAASLSRLFQPGEICKGFGARDLWTHCIAVGVCGRLLGMAGACRDEEAFVAGLVHDLGLMIEYQLFPQKLRQVAEKCLAEGGDFCALERQIIGADHQAFGVNIATRWKFPPGLRYAIGYHHDPSKLQPDLKRLVTTIQVADTICCQNQIGFYLTAYAGEVTEEQLATIGVSASKVAEVVEALPDRIAETEQIFRD